MQKYLFEIFENYTRYDTIFMKIHNDNSRKNRLDKPLTKKTKVAPIYPSLAVYIQYEHSMFLNEIR